MNATVKRPPLEPRDAVSVLSDLLEQGMQLSLDILDSLSASSMSTMDRAMSSSSTVRELRPRLEAVKLPLTSSSCEIPPPCWAPQPIGDVVCNVCPGGTATLRFRVTNCGVSRRDIQVETSRKNENVQIEPPGLVLGPMERDFVTVTTSVPADAASGQEYEVLLWVRGCQNHYLRWTLKVASRGANCCYEVEVEDCPDLVHHWYDHFYCNRPCVN